MRKVVVRLVGLVVAGVLLIPTPALTSSVAVEDRVTELERLVSLLQDDSLRLENYVTVLFEENDRLRGQLLLERRRRRHQLLHLRHRITRLATRSS